MSAAISTGYANVPKEISLARPSCSAALYAWARRSNPNPVTPDEVAEMAAQYRAGGYGYGHAKQALYEALERRVGPQRQAIHEALRAAGIDPDAMATPQA